jgi:DNA-directed RNA polymerase subunit RPC12/RpoP
MSSPYNMAFACLECHKSFKRAYNLDKECPETLRCPNCGGTAYNFGRHFKAPKKTDKKQWEKIHFLFEHGFRVQKIRTDSGHHDTVAYPEKLEEAKNFVAKYKDYAIKNK